MSHQTGIKANAELLKFFAKCKDGKTRVIKISIENEELALSAHKDVKKDFEKDYDKMIPPLVEEHVPCYILYRLDTKTSLGYGWMLLSWTPDTATIRLKMLYASTKATLKLEFGSARILEEIFATELKEVTFEGYKRHHQNVAAPVPLTTREEELAELKRTEVKTDFSPDSRQQTLGGISCPIVESAQKAIEDMRKGSYNYLQFRIDLDNEEIHIAKADNLNSADLPAQVPNDHARYHIFLFKHSHEGDYQESLVFIYSMPGYSCSVKERMLYSSSKGPFLDTLQRLGLDIVKKLEIDDPSEVSEENLHEELHPKKLLHRPQFAKPKGPQNRGPKRLTKAVE